MNILSWIRKEKEVVLFVIWTASILIVGGEVYQHLAELAGIVVLYLVFDAVYYGSQILATSTAVAKIHIERLERPTIWEKIMAAASHDPVAWRLAWVAAIVGLLQPTAAFIVARVLGLDVAVHWAGYVYLIYDFVSTLVVWCKVLGDIAAERNGRVRAATLDAVEELVRLEQVAFPDPTQQFSAEEIGRALKTSPGTILVLVVAGRIVGAIYGRLIRADDFRSRSSPTWAEMANGCDFTPPPGADALYVVNIAGLPGHDVSDRLEAAMGRVAVGEMKLRYVWGGPRIPRFHRWAQPQIVEEYLKAHAAEVDQYEATTQSGLREAMLAPRPAAAPQGLTLEEYVLGTGADGQPLDPLLRTLVREGGFNLGGRRVQLLRVVGGLEGYFGDPPSLDRGALVEFKNPFFDWPLPALWGWLLEQLVLYL